MSAAGQRDPVVLWRSGRAAEALELCRDIERAAPTDARIPGLMGAILASTGRGDEALACLERAVALAPRDRMIRYQLGSTLLARGDASSAVPHLEHSLAVDPRFAPALNDLGQAYLRSARTADAVATLRRAALFHPADPVIAFSLASACRAGGDLPAALAAARRSTSLDARNGDAWLLLLDLAERVGGPADALASAHAAAAALPGSAPVLTAAGKVLATHAAIRDGLRCLERAVALAPADVPALVNLGITRMRLGERGAARALLERALHLAPRHAGVLYNLGNLEYRCGDYAAAVSRARKAVEADPAFALGHHCLASWLLETKQSLDEAVGHADRACELAQANPLVLGTALMAHATAWNAARVETLWSALRAAWAEGQPLPAGLLFAISTDPTEQRQAAAARARTILADLGGVAPTVAHRPTPRPPSARLRVGYLSPDFGDHPVGASLVEVLERHDRTRVETFGLSLLEREHGAIRSRLVGSVEHFHELGARESPDLAGFIRDLDLDLLVDLAGYTSGAREEALALRPAPLQASYLGFPGTQGADWIDYLIADHVVLPPGADAGYREQLVRLPGCFFPTDALAPAPGAAPTRGAEGLPDDAVVLCCFNVSARVTAPLVGAWCRVLAAAPDAILWLGAMHPIAERNVRDFVAARGIDPGRLCFARRTPTRAEHLARHALADLYLDTFPYNGHSTTRDALWLGLPVLTCMGRTFASRVAGSLLTSLGLGELVTADLDAYVETATALAGDAGRRTDLRQRLAGAIRDAIPAGSAHLARHLESAYEQMVARARAGLAPAPITVGLRGGDAGA